jgi:hypothetical protein
MDTLANLLSQVLDEDDPMMGVFAPEENSSSDDDTAEDEDAVPPAVVVGRRSRPGAPAPQAARLAAQPLQWTQVIL